VAHPLPGGGSSQEAGDRKLGCPVVRVSSVRIVQVRWEGCRVLGGVWSKRQPAEDFGLGHVGFSNFGCLSGAQHEGG
jgi:hypothetical protein